MGPKAVRERRDFSFSPTSFRTLRLASNLSLADIGRRLSVTRGYVRQLESGDRQPSPSMLAAVAEILHAEPKLLCRSDRYLSVLPESDFRSTTTRKRDRESAQAYTALTRQLVGYFIDRWGMVVGATKLPRLELATEKGIDLAAARCRAALGLPALAPIANLVRVVESAGVFVIDFDSVAPSIDAFCARTDPPIIVRSTLKGSTSRARLNLAHELAHLVLHRDARPGDPLHEQQANEFASAFLFPTAAFEREFPATNRWIWGDLFRLKARWGLSVAAIVLRAQQLGKIDAERGRNMWIYMSSRGWRRSPEPDEPEPEQPELLVAAFAKIYEIKGVRPSAVLEELGWTDALCRRVLGRDIYESVQRIAPPPIRLLDRGPSWKLDTQRPSAEPDRPDET